MHGFQNVHCFTPLGEAELLKFSGSGPNPARTRKFKPEPENSFKAQIMPEKTRKLS